MRGARIYYPRVPGLMRDDHRRISPRCVTNRNSSCTTSLDHTRYKTLPAHTPDGPTRYKTLPARLARRPTRYKTLPASGLGRPTRYKTLPARPARRPTRYKTLPASPKTPISAHFSHAGRTLYRFRHQQPEQGELYPACGAASGTKLSQQATLAGPPGTKLSQRARLGGPPGTKLSQQAPKRRFRPTFRMQGELCTASATNTTSRANNFAHQHPTAPQQRAPLQISHAIRLNELSTKPRNVAIPTT